MIWGEVLGYTEVQRVGQIRECRQLNDSVLGTPRESCATNFEFGQLSRRDFVFEHSFIIYCASAYSNRNMDTFDDPFLLGIISPKLHLIPYHHTTEEAWVIGTTAQGNNTFFDAQWIQCSYQISGGYGHTPRYIYYFLILFAMWQRRTNWLAEAAMASIMVYSGSAAIHAVILAAIRKRMAPQSMLENYEQVRVEGVTVNGTSVYWDNNIEQWTWNPLDNSLWLPVLPMAWDSDIDAPLAIVGTAFLILLPMQIWSRALRKSRVKIIIWLWGVLLLIPHGAHDSLPLMSDGTQTVGDQWDGKTGIIGIGPSSDSSCRKPTPRL